MESLENGSQPHSQATPLWSMRVISQRWRYLNADAWCKWALKEYTARTRNSTVLNVTKVSPFFSAGKKKHHEIKPCKQQRTSDLFTVRVRSTTGGYVFSRSTPGGGIPTMAEGIHTLPKDLLHDRRYASYFHAGGLSCYILLSPILLLTEFLKYQLPLISSQNNQVFISVGDSSSSWFFIHELGLKGGLEVL